METSLTEFIQGNRAASRRERRLLQREGQLSRINVGRGERLLSTVLGGLLTVYGLKRRNRGGYGMALMGAEMLYRGTTGHCNAYGALGINTNEERSVGEVIDVDHAKAVNVRRSIEIARPREELFAIWRDFSNLPQFMSHLQRVDVLSDTKSHWVTTGPVGLNVEWDAEIVAERENEWIAWQAVEPAQVPNNGTVMFRETPGGNTEIFVTLEAQPPAGKFGALIARMFGKAPDRQVRMALEKFRQMAESGFDWTAAGKRATEKNDHGEEELSLQAGPGESDHDTTGRSTATKTTTRSRSQARADEWTPAGDDSESRA
ncbi:MAG: SRPBCC family protein [Gemmatimonas sp.]